MSDKQDTPKRVSKGNKALLGALSKTKSNPKPDTPARERELHPTVARSRGIPTTPEKNQMLREAKEKLAETQETVQALEAEKAAMSEELEKASDRADSIELTMPVTTLSVRFTKQTIPANQIFVSPENGRLQESLNRHAVDDIYNDIRHGGQQEPGMVRPRPDGRYELIYGSRRLWCVRDLGRDYLALVGEVPDSDVAALAKVENSAKPLSPYEQALRYRAMIDSKQYKSWKELGNKEDVSQSQWSFYKALTDLDPVVLAAFPDLNEVPLRFGSTIRTALEKNSDGLPKLLKEAKSIRAEWDKAGTEKPDAKAIINRLKAALVKKKRGPQWSDESLPGGGEVRWTRANGVGKVELRGVSDDTLDELIEWLKAR